MFHCEIVLMSFDGFNCYEDACPFEGQMHAICVLIIKGKGTVMQSGC